MGVSIDTNGGPSAVDVWSLAKGDMATVITPANLRGHVVVMTAYGPWDLNDLTATFLPSFPMNVLKWLPGASITLTVTQP